MDGNEERKVGIPESIVINGVTYYVKDTPELQQFIQEVAKVEKSKLYTQFENLKAQIANLGKVRVTGSSLDIDAIVDKLKGTFVTKEDLQSVLPDVIKEVVQPVLIATEQNKKEELEKYRNKIISENIATCIPDLVKGETKEELDASLQESIRLRAAYPTPSTVNIDPNAHVSDPLIQQQAKDMGVNIPQTPTPIPPVQSNAAPIPPATPRRSSPEVGAPEDIKKMPISEFEKKRESLKQQLEAIYGGGLS